MHWNLAKEKNLKAGPFFFGFTVLNMILKFYPTIWFSVWRILNAVFTLISVFKFKIEKDKKHQRFKIFIIFTEKKLMWKCCQNFIWSIEKHL